MLPQRLALRNFMCYRGNGVSLDFRSVHVACLCGNNGHGKSALLDAITWALWGEARARDDDLITLGQSEMEVELEFLVGEQRYRVVRKRARAKRTGLELTVHDGNAFRSISGDSVRDTDGKIVRLLRMDYETFINSAYLVQGRADLFTLKSAAERKQVLADILGLSYYAELEERAKERAKERAQRHQWLTTEAQRLEQEVGKKATVKGRVDELRKSLETKRQQAQEQAKALEALRQRHAALAVRQRTLDDLTAEERRLDQQLRDVQAQQRMHQEAAQRYASISARASEIAEGYRRLQEAESALEVLDQARAGWQRLRDRRQELVHALEQAKSKLTYQCETLQARSAELQAKAQREAQVKEEEQRLQPLRAAHADRERVLTAKREALEQVVAEGQGLKSDIERLTREVQEAEQKSAMLAHAGASCPLCGTELGPEGHDRVRGSYETQAREAGLALKQTEAQRAQKVKEYEALQKEIKGLDRQVKTEEQRFAGWEQMLQRDMQESQQAVQEMDTVSKQLAQLQASLAAGAFAQDERVELGRIEADLKASAYDPQAHDTQRARRTSLRAFAEQHLQLTEAQARLPQVQEALAKVAGLLDDLAQRREQVRQERQRLALELAELPALTRQVQEQQASLALVQDEERQLGWHMAQAEAEAQRIEQQERQLADVRTEHKQVAEEVDSYEQLAEAFGKKGVQALIIESALPELEQEANALLARMTDGRMSLKLETQVEKRSQKGEVKETLEVHIADEQGTRGYELFSGGEAFRINFALRIALSKLLARRAGASLPTLFIDEGFGTQDAEGRAKLLEAISAIQDDFQRIIVITHIEELKEAFTDRIEVTKTPDGSTVTVS